MTAQVEIKIQERDGVPPISYVQRGENLSTLIKKSIQNIKEKYGEIEFV